MKVLVTGGRDYHDVDKVWTTLDEFHENREITLLIQGGASGADIYAQVWAHKNDIPYLTIPAQWEKHGRSAGPRRNTQMLNFNPDYVIAFPGGNGTADMVRQSKKAGLKVLQIT